VSEDDYGLGLRVHEDAYRELERERDEWKATQRENVQLKREVDRERALANEAIATWRKTKEERDEALEYVDKLAQGLPEGMLPKDVEVLREANLGLATNIAAVTEQRDRLADQIEANHKGTLMLERMVYQLREQNDRLAAVLQRIRDGYGGQVASPNCCEDCDFLIPIDKALQSLTPKP
jgi:chromosome segregation ATPase